MINPVVVVAVVVADAEISRAIGINYGQLGDNLPSPAESISLIRSLKAGRVKIYDANPDILRALSNTSLQVSVMLPNQLISNLSASQPAADAWVRANLLPFYPATKIRILLVGNEVLSFPDEKQNWHDLVPAMRRLRRSLKSLNLRKVKVGTPLAMDALATSFPPSNGSFRADIAGPVIKPLLQFLNRTRSFYFLDVYTYFTWAANHKTIDLDYALLNRTEGVKYTDPISGLVYDNLLDQILDAVHAAMAAAGYPGVRIWIAETGWPNAGDVDQIGASVRNAAVYNRNLARRVAAKPPEGTPARPGAAVRAFVFSLYNENRKGGQGTERHWGLLYPNGTAVYEVDLTGRRPESAYAPLPPASNNEPYEGPIWCVVGETAAGAAELGGALAYACGQGNGTCDGIRPGEECYKPDSLVSHASYAFNSYWHQYRALGGTCYFNGLATQTTVDPSKLGCFPPPPPCTVFL